MDLYKDDEKLLIALESANIKTPRVLVRPELIKKFTHGKKINNLKQRQANIEKASEWQKQKKVMHVKSGEDLEVIISTDFRTYIEETLNYLFSLHEENEIVTSLEHIKTKFVNIPEDAPA